MNDKLVKYGLLYSKSNNSHTFSELKKLEKKLLEKDAELIWTVKARSWGEACQKRNDYLGWGKYTPLDDVGRASSS